ncbi:zinc finger protein 1035 [Stigmatopora nigra]
MAHEWDTYLQNITPLSPESKTLRTSEPEGSLAQHIETFVGQDEFSNSTGSHDPPATDSTFDTNFYSSVGNSTSDCAYDSFYRESPWEPDEELILKDTSLRCEGTDVNDIATNGLSSSGPLPSSYSVELEGLKQNCELLASSLLEDYSDVSSCSDRDANETRPPCKFMTTPNQESKSDSLTKRSPSEWLISHPENVTFSNEINDISPGSLKYIHGENLAECLPDANQDSEKNGTFNTEYNQEFSDIPTTDSGSIKDSNDEERLPIQEAMSSVAKDLIGVDYSDVSIRDNENRSGTEDDPDHMEQENVTPEHTKPSFAKVEDGDHELEKEEEINESCPIEKEARYNNSPAIEQEINLTNVEDTYGAVNQMEENELDSLGEEPFNVPKETNTVCSQDEIMEIDVPQSETEVQCEENKMKPDNPQFSDPPESECNNIVSELAECSNMLLANSQDIGACVQLLKDQPSQKVLDNICCSAPICDGPLTVTSDKLSLRLDSGPSQNSTTPTENSLASDDLGRDNKKPDNEITFSCPEESCSSADTNICDKKAMVEFHKENQTSSQDENCSSETIDNSILDLDAENKHGTSNDLKCLPQKSDLTNECCSSKDQDTGETSPQCHEKSHDQSQFPSAQEQTLCTDENVKVFPDVRDTSEKDKLVLIERSGEPPIEKPIVQSNSNIKNGSQAQDCIVKSSLQMRKRLQPVVIIKKMEPASSSLYQCAVCQQITHRVDHLIEHYHCEHSDQIFQYSQQSNQYLISNGLPDKHVSNKPQELQQLASAYGKRQIHCCSFCDKKFSRTLKYLTHMRLHTGKTPFKCNECNMYFAQKGSLNRHLNKTGMCKKLQTANPDVVSIVRKVFKLVKDESRPSTPQIDAMDMARAENLPQCFVNLFDICTANVCVYCGRQYSSPSQVKKHVYNKHKGHPPGVWQNQTTMKLAKRSNLMPLPVEETENEMRHKYKCPLCPRLFMHFYNRARHLRDCARVACRNLKTFGDKFKCPRCHILFTQSNSWYKHIRYVCLKRTFGELPKEKVKSQVKPDGKQNVALENKQKKSELATPITQDSYKCDACPAVFEKESGLSEHVKEHASEGTGKMIDHETPLWTSFGMAKTDETESHVKSDQQTALRCPFCDKNCETELSLKLHERCHTGEKPYLCLDCGRGFKKQVYLRSHKVVHQSVPCTLCKKILPNSRNFIHHIKLYHKGKRVPCPTCKKLLNTAELLNHLKLHKREAVLNEETLKTWTASQDPSEPKTLACPLCQQEFDDIYSIRKHSLEHISSDKTCPYCNQTFKTRRYLLLHMFKHTGEKPHCCVKCGKTFCLKQTLRIHEKFCGPLHNETSPEPEEHRCKICPRTFKIKAHLIVHTKSHLLKTLRVCSHCGMHFGRSKFYLHKKKCSVESSEPRSTSPSNNDACQTSQEESQKVPVMPSQFSQSEMLPLKCSYCPRSFKFRSRLLKHSVSHTGVQPYPCKKCGERFSTITLHLRHEKRCHDVSKEEESKKASKEVSMELTDMPTAAEEARISIERSKDEYKCKFCTKTFVKARSLRRHILTHNEVNPYRCKTCGSCFSRYDYLKVHHGHCKGKQMQLQICIPKISLDDVGKGWKSCNASQSMEVQERFECNVCSKSFPTQSTLSRHFTLFHSIKLFRCQYCGAAFSHEKSLKFHKKTKNCKKKYQKLNSTPLQDNLSSQNLNQTHNEEIRSKLQLSSIKRRKYSCGYCFRVFPSNGQLQYHIVLHTGEKPFSCDCGLRFIRKDYLKRHRLKCKVRLCKTCNVAFPQHKLKAHQISCPSTSPQSTKPEENPLSPKMGFSCAYCSLRFSLFSQLQEHFLAAHKMETIDIPVSTAPLQHHLAKLPTDEANRSDQQPSDGSNLTCKLDKELVGDVSESFLCSICNISFENKAGLKGHCRIHSKHIPYKCKTCGKGFWNKNLFRNHNRKCRHGYYTEKNAAQKTPVNAHLNLTLPDSVLVSETDIGVLQENISIEDSQESPQNPVKDQDQTVDQDQGSSIKNEEKVTQYQCSECDLSFTDGLMLISHLEEHGREEQAHRRTACIKCTRVFPNVAEMETHLRSHGLTKSFSCSECSMSFFTASDLEIHKSYHDPNRTFSCNQCGYRFWSRQSLGNHHSEEHREIMHPCRFCEKTYASMKSLRRHYKSWHLKEQKNSESNVASENGKDECNSSDDSDSAPYFPCHVCGKTFPTSENLEDHQKCHLGVKPHECAECGRCFFQAAQLEQHKRMHKSELQCQVCGRGFVSLFALRKHKHTHGKSRPHRCSKCQLSFSGASQLAEHMSNHREENFPCDICNQVFPSKSSRAEHRKVHTMSIDRHEHLLEKSTPLSESSTIPNLQYNCALCNESFTDSMDFSEHGCNASRDRPYSCPDCDRHFLHSSHLRKHSVLHRDATTETEYFCNCCTITSLTLEHFIRHLKTHENEAIVPGKNAQTYKCPTCGCSFIKVTDLISHFSVHSANRLNCKICKMSFSAKRELEDHEQRHQSSFSQLQRKMGDKKFQGSGPFHSSSDPVKSPNTHINLGKRAAESNHNDVGEEDEIHVTEVDLHHCSFCTKQFFSKSVLLEHQNKVHLNEQFKCKYCPKLFAYKHTLQNHEQMVHMKPAQPAPLQNSLKCSQCFFNFNTLQDLSSHMRTHAEQQFRQYRCDMCYKSFAYANQLQHHQESHVGQIVYECAECDKAFAFPNLLAEHQKTHA